MIEDFIYLYSVIFILAKSNQNSIEVQEFTKPPHCQNMGSIQALLTLVLLSTPFLMHTETISLTQLLESANTTSAGTMC